MNRAACRKRELENIKEEGKSNQEQKSCTTCQNPNNKLCRLDHLKPCSKWV